MQSPFLNVFDSSSEARFFFFECVWSGWGVRLLVSGWESWEDVFSPELRYHLYLAVLTHLGRMLLIQLDVFCPEVGMKSCQLAELVLKLRTLPLKTAMILCMVFCVTTMCSLSALLKT